MAFVISELHAPPQPQPGESVLLLMLSENPETGYRLSAKTVGDPLRRISPRIVGRWASDCPLAVSQAALLWVSQYPWQMQMDPEGIDVNLVLDEVPAIQQVPPTHPLDTLDLLLGNWPKREPTALTGAVARFRRPNQPDMVVHDGGGERQSIPQLTAEENELHLFLGKAMAALEHGADAGTVLARTIERYDLAPGLVDLRGEALVPDVAPILAQPIPVAAIPGPADLAPEALDPADVDVEALLAEVDEDLEGFIPPELDADIRAKREQGLLTYGGDHDRIAKKLKRTTDRGNERIAHVRAHLARQGETPVVEVAPNGAPKALTPAQAVAVHKVNLEQSLSRVRRQRASAEATEAALMAEAVSVGLIPAGTGESSEPAPAAPAATATPVATVVPDAPPAPAPASAGPTLAAAPSGPGSEGPFRKDFVEILVARDPAYEDTEATRKKLMRLSWGELSEKAQPFMGSASSADAQPSA